jgi:hypothetical protein
MTVRPGFAVVLGFCLVMTAGACRSTSRESALTLPAPLQGHLQTDRFAISTSIKGLPLGVRDRLEEMFGQGTLQIAEPGAEFRRNDPGNSQLPTRRLIAAGCAADHHCLVYYERGGASLTHHAALFQWSPAETRFEFGGTAPAGLLTVDDVQKAMLSGAIRKAADSW